MSHALMLGSHLKIVEHGQRSQIEWHIRGVIRDCKIFKIKGNP